MKGLKLQYSRLNNSIKKHFTGKQIKQSFIIYYHGFVNQLHALNSLLLRQVNVELSIEKVYNEIIESLKKAYQLFNDCSQQSSERSQCMDQMYDIDYAPKIYNNETQRDQIYKYLYAADKKQQDTLEIIKNINRVTFTKRQQDGKLRIPIQTNNQEVQTQLNMINLSQNQQGKIQLRKQIFQQCKNTKTQLIMENNQQILSQTNQQNQKNWPKNKITKKDKKNKGVNANEKEGQLKTKQIIHKIKKNNKYNRDSKSSNSSNINKINNIIKIDEINIINSIDNIDNIERYDIESGNQEFIKKKENSQEIQNINYNQQQNKVENAQKILIFQSQLNQKSNYIWQNEVENLQKNISQQFVSITRRDQDFQEKNGSEQPNSHQNDNKFINKIENTKKRFSNQKQNKQKIKISLPSLYDSKTKNKEIQISGNKKNKQSIKQQKEKQKKYRYMKQIQQSLPSDHTKTSQLTNENINLKEHKSKITKSDSLGKISKYQLQQLEKLMKQPKKNEQKIKIYLQEIKFQHFRLCGQNCRHLQRFDTLINKKYQSNRKLIAIHKYNVDMIEDKQ